jgi:hypothetical protein
MKCLYFDCFAGISGDMTLAALIDLGVPQRHITAELRKLKLTGYSVCVSRAMKMGISGKKIAVRVQTREHHRHRSYRDIETLIRKSSLKSGVKERSLDIFLRIAKAEAKVHSTSIDDIHFHEVGALDSLVDIVGSVIGIDYLGAEVFQAPALPLGHGFVKCQHGILPLPAPATVLLLKGVPVCDAGVAGELVTPTGAAIITSYVRQFGGMPAMTVAATGYGAGTMDLPDRPNMLRLMLGETQDAAGADWVWVLETNIDDMNPEHAGYVMERLFAAGALDVMLTPVYMKKNRPGVLLTVICADQARSQLTRVLFQETTTAGIRSGRMQRTVLQRRQGSIQTRFGRMKVKIFTGEAGEYAMPEFEECRRAAQKHGVPLKTVYEEVIACSKKVKRES